ALKEGAPQVNPRHPNILARAVLKRGDAEAALASSTHRVSGVWKTQRIEHLYLEPESAVAEPLRGGGGRLRTHAQGASEDRRQLATFLGLKEEEIVIDLFPNGGGFGGKEDMSVQARVALLAFLSQRPVKMTLNREESIRMHPKRHPMTLHYTMGC